MLGSENAINDVKIARPIVPKTEMPSSTRCLLITPAKMQPNAIPTITIAQTTLVSRVFKFK